MFPPCWGIRRLRRVPQLTGDGSASPVAIRQVSADTFVVTGIGTKINVNGQNFWNSFTYEEMSPMSRSI